MHGQRKDAILWSATGVLTLGKKSKQKKRLKRALRKGGPRHVRTMHEGQTRMTALESGTPDSDQSRPAADRSAAPPDTVTHTGAARQLLPLDAEFMAQARDQWQHGDWGALAEVSVERIEHHRDRAKAALLVAAAHLQQGENARAQHFLRHAREWGCDRRLIAQILISGVYNSLGKAELARGRDQNALGHFRGAIGLALPNTDSRLLAEARAVRESVRLGLLPQAAKLMNEQVATAKASARLDETRLSIIETELGLLHHELSLAQQRQQLSSPRTGAESETSHLEAPDWLSRLQQKAVSQLGQDLWVLEQTDYKRNGFFVEFGATDGVLLSNTWLLEREFGWKGICAEPNPDFFEQLKKNRACDVSDAYIGGLTGATVEFILSDAYGGSSEYAADDQHAAKREAYRQAGKVMTLVAVSLNDFLEQHGAPRDIDYISIDTEGSEYEILSTFPFHQWRVRLFTVEHNFTDRRQDIRRLMEKNGYTCQEAKWDDWYVRVAQ